MHKKSCKNAAVLEIRIRFQRIKDKVPPCPSKFLLQIPEEIEPDALLYADRRHRGFADAFKRLQTWADFPDMEIKVVQTIIWYA